MRGPSKESKRNAPFWVKAFVVFHVIAITSWSLPRPRPDLVTGKETVEINTTTPLTAVQTAGKALSDSILLMNERHVRVSPVQQYLLTTGFWQYWDMFAPNPSSVDYYGTAEVTFADGSTLTYEYPRIYTMPIPAKYLNERYRKFYERASSSNFQYIWPHFAQRVALLSYEDKDNPPVRVKLFKHSLPIAKPGAVQQQEYSVGSYYEHVVDLDLLRRLAREQ